MRALEARLQEQAAATADALAVRPSGHAQGVDVAVSIGLKAHLLAEKWECDCGKGALV